MDIKTGLSIYNKQWLIEPSAAAQMLDFWMETHQGWTSDTDKPKGDLSNKFFAASKIAFAPTTSNGMYGFDGFGDAETVIIQVSGPLMKGDNCGDLGTASLKALTQIAANTPSVNTIVFMVDSPGGTVDGTKSFADTIKGCGKNTICVADGLMCSAAYWIGSSCDKVFAASTTDIIGSIGTMCTIVDASAALEKKGYVIREYYASASTDKNKIYSDAEKGDGKALISEMLDPMNNEFMGTVKANRAGKINEAVLTGKTYMAEQATEMGLVDGIKSMDEVLQMAATMRNTKHSFIQSKKHTVMTADQIKTAHPEAYEAIMTAGATAERDRVIGWLAWKDTDAEMVSKGIAEGTTLTQGMVSVLSQKEASKARLKAAEADNPQPVNVDPVTDAKSEEELSLETNMAAVLKALKSK